MFSAALQIETANLTDRVNVIDFVSLFSGTAVAPTEKRFGPVEADILSTLTQYNFGTPRREGFMESHRVRELSLAIGKLTPGKSGYRTNEG